MVLGYVPKQCSCKEEIKRWKCKINNKKCKWKSIKTKAAVFLLVFGLFMCIDTKTYTCIPTGLYINIIWNRKKSLVYKFSAQFTC